MSLTRERLFTGGKSGRLWTSLGRRPRAGRGSLLPGALPGPHRLARGCTWPMSPYIPRAELIRTRRNPRSQPTPFSLLEESKEGHSPRQVARSRSPGRQHWVGQCPPHPTDMASVPYGPRQLPGRATCLWRWRSSSLGQLRARRREPQARAHGERPDPPLPTRACARPTPLSTPSEPRVCRSSSAGNVVRLGKANLALNSRLCHFSRRVGLQRC